MKLYTQRDKIKEVYKSWMRQYPPHKTYVKAEHRLVGEKLRELNLETVAAKEIDDIIGNDSWTKDACNECGEYKENHILLGDKEGRTFHLCTDCAKIISKFLSA